MIIIQLKISWIWKTAIISQRRWVIRIRGRWLFLTSPIEKRQEVKVPGFILNHENNSAREKQMEA
jgi:hypothetical protein